PYDRPCTRRNRWQSLHHRQDNVGASAVRRSGGLYNEGQGSATNGSGSMVTRYSRRGTPWNGQTAKKQTPLQILFQESSNASRRQFGSHEKRHLRFRPMDERHKDRSHPQRHRHHQVSKPYPYAYAYPYPYPYPYPYSHTPILP